MLHVPFLLQATIDLWPRVALRDDLAEAPIGGLEDTPQAERRPTRVLRGIGDGVEKYWERPAQALLTIDNVADTVVGQGNTRCFKIVTMRCKAKAQEGPRVQLPQVHMPVVVVSRGCEGTKTWAFVVYSGPGSGKYEHIMYDNGVGDRRGATWLQAAIRIGGGSDLPPLPPQAVWYMDQKIAEYVGRKEKGMLGSRTHVTVEESSGDEEQPERKRPTSLWPGSRMRFPCC